MTPRCIYQLVLTRRLTRRRVKHQVPPSQSVDLALPPARRHPRHSHLPVNAVMASGPLAALSSTLCLLRRSRTCRCASWEVCTIDDSKRSSVQPPDNIRRLTTIFDTRLCLPETTTQAIRHDASCHLPASHTNTTENKKSVVAENPRDVVL